MSERASRYFSGTVLAQRRRWRGLSQDELARRSEVATVTVQKLEEGRILDPRSSTLLKLAKGLDCPVGDLLAETSVTRRATRRMPRGGRCA